VLSLSARAAVAVQNADGVSKYAIVSLRYNPSGSRIVYLDTKGTVGVLDCATRQRVLSFDSEEGSRSRVIDVTASGTEDVVGIMTDQSLTLRRSSNEPQRLTLTEGESPYTFCFSPDGKYIAVALRVPPFGEGRKSVVQIWKLDTLKKHRRVYDFAKTEFSEMSATAVALSFSPDGTALAIGASVYGIALPSISGFEVSYGKQQFYELVNGRIVRRVGYCPDGSSVFALSAMSQHSGDRVVIKSGDNMANTRAFAVNDAIDMVQYDRDTVVIAEQDGIRVVEFSQSAPRVVRSRQIDGCVSLARSHDGREISVGTLTGRIHSLSMDKLMNRPDR